MTFVLGSDNVGVKSLLFLRPREPAGGVVTVVEPSGWQLSFRDTRLETPRGLPLWAGEGTNPSLDLGRVHGVQPAGLNAGWRILKPNIQTHLHNQELV